MTPAPRPGGVATGTWQVPPPGRHGGDGPALARALGVDPSEVLDLSQSLNPLAPDVASVVAAHLDELGRYPDATRATAVLAGALGCGPDEVVLTNGGSEAIALVARAVGGGVADEPEFSLHPRGATGPRWRSNPSNPRGTLAGPAERAGVWDEAFFPLATGRWTRGDLDRGSVVVGSLTKLWACPGLRIGYVASRDRALVARLRADQPEWPVNGLAAAVVEALVPEVDLAGWARGVAGLRAELVDLLAGHGLAARATDACWALVEGAGDLRAELAGHGVLVRDCAGFGLPGTVRVAVPGPSGLERLEAALCRRG
ncbi:MAG: aminotransferase class I/II-fold pyridoxal phosphate-dependent enzyme [Acidimicrobiia bacterium]